MGLHKVIQSGSEVESYEYQKDVSPYIGLKKRGKSERREQFDRRKDNIRAVSRAFRRVVLSNLVDNTPFFVTLTFRDFVGIKQGYSKLSNFHQKLRYHFGSSFRFVAVPEFGTRATKRLHFHVLYWNLPSSVSMERSTRLLAGLWGNGFVDLVVTDGSPKLASYMSKYVFKALSNKQLLKQKAYVCSRNVYRPTVFTNHLYYSSWGDQKEGWDTGYALDLMTVDKSLRDTHHYDTMWLGRCIYQLYN